jgi:hypothetical protein
MAANPCSNGEYLKGLTTPTRNKYFYGKLMDAFHFDLEQRYGVRKHALLSRLALGHGVLCGLQVAPTADGKQVVVGQGVGKDDLGREIVVPEQSQPVDPRQPTDDCGRPDGDRLSGSDTVYLCLAYHECEAEPVPVFTGDCDAKEGCAASVIRERYSIIVRKGAPPEIKPTCRFPNLFAPPPGGSPPQLYSKLVEHVSQPCMDPEETCLVLAKISLPAGNAPITAAMIDPTFRPLVYSNELLFELLVCLSQQVQPVPTSPKCTTITNLSWDHDKSLVLDKFMDGLLITFSDNPTSAITHGEAWFIVTVEYPVRKRVEGRPDLMPGTILVQHVLAEKIQLSGKTASFEPAPAFKETFIQTVKLLGEDVSPLCRVVLKCNALSGVNGLAVDGDFLLGKLPSGDGTAGGDFESWFVLRR